MIGRLRRALSFGRNPSAAAPQYVWDGDNLLPSAGELDIAIGDLSLTLDLRFPHERRYALGLLHGLRNPQADIDRALFQNYVRPGDVILDAGANIGVAAAEALACGASQVICIEPEKSVATRLSILKSRKPDRITMLNCALGAQVGQAELSVSQTHNQGHTLSPKMMSLFPSLFDGTLQTVEVKTIDGILVSRRADIWKIDVEGAEADVIRGGRQTLELSPPRTILVELYDPFVEEFAALLPQFQIKRAALTVADYTLQLIDQMGGVLTDEFCSTSPMYVFTR
jgi:FkbM family methyltransferase